MTVSMLFILVVVNVQTCYERMKKGEVDKKNMAFPLETFTTEQDPKGISAEPS
jgi:hypothetical protein